jgi:mannan endo-1,6-alpha-mannosidase
MFWGLAAMLAAELKFPDTGKFSWLSLAQGVFNTQTARWDTTTCGGGLRWQIFPYQDGYTMKNSVSNGGLFQLSARLARYTNNDKYTKWAEKIWDWSTSSVLVNNKTWNVADSTEMSNNCGDAGNYQWSYNYGAYLMGAAYMYNFVSGIPLFRASRNHLSFVTHTKSPIPSRQTEPKSGKSQSTASSTKP